MGFYNSLFWHVPESSGKRIYVAPSASYTVEGVTCSASDSQDGTDIRSAKLTLNSALAACTANAGDVITLLPGAHSYAVAVAVNVAGVTITGTPRTTPGFRGRKNSGGVRALTSVTSTAAIFTVTVADVEISHLHFIPAVTLPGIQLTSASANRTYIHDCTFNTVGTGDTNTMGIYLGAAVTDTVIANCFWHNEGSNGPGILIGAVVTVDTLVENCTFRLGGDTAWADAIKTLGVSLGNVFRDIDFILRNSAIAITDGIDVAAATTDGATTILRCMFAVGCNLTNANVADNQVAENYTMQAAASVGGTLILST